MRVVNLYIKAHKVTDLQYFGRTVNKNVDKYPGSGKHWKNHLKTHGKESHSITVGKFNEDDPMLVDFALGFSAANDIVLSKDWANQIAEQGTHLTDTSGYSSVKDVYNNSYFLPVTHPKILSGEYFGHTKGRTVVKNTDGESFSVEVDDPRIVSGELVGINKGVQMPGSMSINLKEAHSNKHPSSKIIKIYNSRGEFVLHSERNFKNLCEALNMPHNEFLKSIKSNGEYKVFDKLCSWTESKHLQLNREIYRGWYSKDVGRRYDFSQSEIDSFYERPN